MVTQEYQSWEQLAPNVYRTWQADNQIIAYKVFDAKRESVDAWANGIRETYENWNNSKPYLAVYDFSVIFALSPYSRQRVKELVELAKKLEIKGAYAIVLGNNLVSFALQLFVRRELDQQNRNFERQFFDSREPAIEWLKEWL
jgi:hypothetical protein